MGPAARRNVRACLRGGGATHSVAGGGVCGGGHVVGAHSHIHLGAFHAAYSAHAHLQLIPSSGDSLSRPRRCISPFICSSSSLAAATDAARYTRNLPPRFLTRRRPAACPAVADSEKGGQGGGEHARDLPGTLLNGSCTAPRVFKGHRPTARSACIRCAACSRLLQHRMHGCSARRLCICTPVCLCTPHLGPLQAHGPCYAGAQ